jgi:hypothetical protein
MLDVFFPLACCETRALFFDILSLIWYASHRTLLFSHTPIVQAVTDWMAQHGISSFPKLWEYFENRTLPMLAVRRLLSLQFLKFFLFDAPA